MPEPINQDLPAPKGVFDGRRMESSPSLFAKIARWWCPRSVTLEPPAATVSRYSLRLIDQATGEAFTISELVARFGAVTSVAGKTGEVTLEAEDIDGLQAVLNDEINGLSSVVLHFDVPQSLSGPQQTQGLSNLGAAAAVHTHSISDVTNLQSILNNKANVIFSADAPKSAGTGYLVEGSIPNAYRGLIKEAGTFPDSGGRDGYSNTGGSSYPNYYTALYYSDTFTRWQYEAIVDGFSVTWFYDGSDADTSGIAGWTWEQGPGAAGVPDFTAYTETGDVGSVGDVWVHETSNGIAGIYVCVSESPVGWQKVTSLADLGALSNSITSHLQGKIDDVISSLDAYQTKRIPVYFASREESFTNYESDVSDAGYLIVFEENGGDFYVEVTPGAWEYDPQADSVSYENRGTSSFTLRGVSGVELYGVGLTANDGSGEITIPPNGFVQIVCRGENTFSVI